MYDSEDSPDGCFPPNITTWSSPVIVREKPAQGGGLDPFIEGEDHSPRFHKYIVIYVATLTNIREWSPHQLNFVVWIKQMTLEGTIILTHELFDTTNVRTININFRFVVVVDVCAFLISLCLESLAFSSLCV